jgi:hypothetical protein
MLSAFEKDSIPFEGSLQSALSEVHTGRDLIQPTDFSSIPIEPWSIPILSLFGVALIIREIRLLVEACKP